MSAIATWDPEDIDVERREWTPNEKQFAAYRARDAELARANIEYLRQRCCRGEAKSFSTGDTLHSRRTLFAAMQGAA